ncbi:tRNA lysidine(34) synthetase TilS [Mesorhizobium xinjiangense]|uniref:tRNA lysidine(34) synthetase TilS n=1 Tax=Mesorhizobium xinjiangense TaxID=2678685 RepID=UPI001F379AE6|nr:tRNA lysidine(34) synthetase TilS [Mesorhizobium xinjiangense]
MLNGSHAAQFATLFDGLDFRPGRTVIAAVSGGSDSTALLLLLQDHLQRTALQVPLLAVTVDHGLRLEAADEARQVAALCASRGIAQRTLRWEGEKPGAALSATAREARYRLLGEAAADSGAGLILTGHTRDDQAETVYMRRRRGDGRGLAGMAAVTLFDGRFWIVRPLLETARADLRALLEAEGVGWIDDPSNTDMASERARARKALSGERAARQSEETLVLAGKAAGARVAEGRMAARLIETGARLVSPGLVELGPAISEADAGAGDLALRILLAAVSGREHLADAARAAKMRARLRQGPFRSTLGGAVLDHRKAGTFLYRERRAGWTGAMPARPGATWDGRYRLSGDATLPQGAVIEAAGPVLATARARDHVGPPPALVRAGLATQPVIRRRDACGTEEIVPLAASLFERLPAPWARFLPGFDMAPAAAVAGLFDCAEIPPSPWPGHNAA